MVDTLNVLEDVQMERDSLGRRKKRSFSPEFRAGAIGLVLDQGKTVAEVARSLDLTASAVTKWVRQARIDRGKGRPDQLTTEEKLELTKLRKENRELRLEREILKKAAAFFAKENA